MIGAWCGVIPIGLDWDRPWQVRALAFVASILQLFLPQAWPLTPAYGAIFGHVLGSLVAFSVSSVYLLAQASIQATAELEKAGKRPEPVAPKTKATRSNAAKKKVQ